MALRTTNMRDALVAEVRQQILSGELAPGTALTEQGLATTFGVARPTVRSALQELEARHLAERADGRSLRVPVLTEADVRDLFRVRLPLEVAAVRAVVTDGGSLAGPKAALAVLEALPAVGELGGAGGGTHGLPRRAGRGGGQSTVEPHLPAVAGGDAVVPRTAPGGPPGPGRTGGGAPPPAGGGGVGQPGRPRRPRQKTTSSER